jgi:hypothetical protein
MRREAIKVVVFQTASANAVRALAFAGSCASFERVPVVVAAKPSTVASPSAAAVRRTPLVLSPLAASH